jgi:LmbE family N-acetylglucosaminyl deacetylase
MIASCGLEPDRPVNKSPMAAKTKNPSDTPGIALAVVAHPDDIEFQIAGTLLLLKEAGWTIHYWNISSGNCGSLEMPPAKTAKVRRAEAREAAALLGAQWHPPIATRPTIVLTHSPQDYMEDHMNVCRLAVTGAFAHGMPNFKVTPHREPYFNEVTVYHCMPHGLVDGLRQPIVPDLFVDTSGVHETKLAALAAHRSQQNWLGSSQKMNSYLQTCDDMSREIGRRSGRFTHAEGWRRHSHLGFCSATADPLRAALGGRALPNRPRNPVSSKKR